MGPHEGVCIVCHKGGTLGCTGMCFKCSTASAPPPQNAIEEIQARMGWTQDVPPLPPGAPIPPPRVTTISPEEHATILAALTYWRQCRLGNAENRPPAIHQIATNGGTLPHVNDTKMKLLLDRLCFAGRTRGV